MLNAKCDHLSLDLFCDTKNRIQDHEVLINCDTIKIFLKEQLLKKNDKYDTYIL